jgi:hypothetical protein
MRINAWKNILVLVIACIAGAAASPVIAGYGERVYTDLHPPGWISSEAVSVNERGEVAGHGITAAGGRGFLWSSGRFTELLPPGAVSCTVAWMSGRGEIAGTAIDGSGTPRAFVYRDGGYVDPVPGWGYSEAYHIGDDGTVTGKGEGGAFVASAGGISTVPAFTAVVARNTRGDLLGIGDNAALLYIYRPGQGYLNVIPPGAESVSPGRINEQGQMTFSSSTQGVVKGYVYAGGFLIFMTPPGWSSSKAASINGHSEVVGFGDSPQGERGFLRSGGDYEEIAYPGWLATRPVSVNDLGQAAGSGETGSGESHAFLSSPASLNVTASGAAIGGDVAAGGGCSVATGRPATASTAGVCNLVLMLSPMGYFLARSLRKVRISRR